MDNQQDIIRQIQNGDESVFEKIFRSHYPGMCGYALKYLGDVEQAEEIVQDVFFNYWNKKEVLDIVSSLEAYLYRAVRNSCLNYLKHLKVKAQYVAVQEGASKNVTSGESDAMVELELQQKIDECVANLPVERQKIFRLSREEGMKYKEIAEQLNLSIKTVEAQMGKALKYLRENLAEYLPLILVCFITGSGTYDKFLKYFVL